MMSARLAPGRSARREAPPNLIVIHAMGEVIDTHPARFAWDHLDSIGLSAHAYVTPSGVVVRQVADSRVAFHAGAWNEPSLGVEVLVPGVHRLPSLYRAMAAPNWVSEPQLWGLSQLVAGWMRGYEIPRERIKGHAELDPERKQDPGAGFPWARLFDYVGTLGA